MAVLNAWDDVRWFPGAERVLAAHGPALPQPDQLCGPFATAAALAAVLADVPSVVGLARAAGTAIWPHDVAGWRPDGAPLDRTGWDELPRATDLDRSGTDARGLVSAVPIATSDDAVAVPVAAMDSPSLGRLLAELSRATYDVGVVANVRTGAMTEGDADAAWDVGHFVVLLGVTGDGRVAVADSYRELGAPDGPPGCRLVGLDALARGLGAPPGRGLLLLVSTHDSPEATATLRTSGLSRSLWDA